MSSFPRNGVVVERARIPATLHEDRELILWMISPTKHEREPSANDPYSCPEETRGSYYTGPTRISLVDTRSKRIINTIRLGPALSDVAEFDIPYRIVSGLYYRVPGAAKGGEGKPTLLELRDLNGDGVAAETAFFEKEACMGLSTALVGYSVSKDEVIQYSAHMRVTSFEREENGRRLGPKQRKGETKIEVRSWIDYLFSEKPVQPRRWKYAVDYRGRGGCNDLYDIHYDAAREAFYGSLNQICPPHDDQ